MKVVVEIPETVQMAPPPADSLARDLLEAYAAARYREESLTQKQVGLLLELDRWATEAFLRRVGAFPALSLEDYALERSGSQ
jgi:hypothetical protein